jgi:hypothetical protein
VAEPGRETWLTCGGGVGGRLLEGGGRAQFLAPAHDAGRRRVVDGLDGELWLGSQGLRGIEVTIYFTSDGVDYQDAAVTSPDPVAWMRALDGVVRVNSRMPIELLTEVDQDGAEGVWFRWYLGVINEVGRRRKIGQPSPRT